MKWLIAFAAAILLGLVAIIARHETSSTGSASSGENTATISTGQTVELNDHLAAGTWTIVEFTADW